MEIQQLRCFVAVAEHGTFSAAAQQLGLTQPALSQSVARLEAEFGTRLFHRSAKGVTLTSPGASMVREAHRVLAAVDLAQQKVDALHGLSTGVLTVATYSTFVAPVGRVAAEFHTRHPGVDLRFPRPGDTRDVVDMVVSGKVDIAFAVIASAADLAMTVDLEVVPIAVDESVALIPAASDAAASGEPIGLPELARSPLIAPRRGHRMRSMLEEMFAAQGLTVDVAVECEDYSVAMDLVGEGLGIHITSRGSFPPDLGPRIGVRPLAPHRQWPVVMLHRTDGISPAAAEFEKLAMAHFNEGGDDAGRAGILLRRFGPSCQSE